MRESRRTASSVNPATTITLPTSAAPAASSRSRVAKPAVVQPADDGERVLADAREATPSRYAASVASQTNTYRSPKTSAWRVARPVQVKTARVGDGAGEQPDARRDCPDDVAAPDHSDGQRAARGDRKPAGDDRRGELGKDDAPARDRLQRQVPECPVGELVAE